MSEKKFGTIVTNEGAALIAECILAGKTLPIVEAAAGDGGGAYYEPTANQTALKGECWRGEIAGVALSEYSPNMIDVKIIIDDAVGGFTVREMGLFTDEGILFAVCNTPDTEKVSITGGIPGRLTMTMHIIVADASVVKVIINPGAYITVEQFNRRLAALVEISSNKTPAVGVKTHYYITKSVPGYVPYDPEAAKVQDGVLETDSGTVRGYIQDETGVRPMALLTE